MKLAIMQPYSFSYIRLLGILPTMTRFHYNGTMGLSAMLDVANQEPVSYGMLHVAWN